MLMNVISYRFSKDYSNIDFPGYKYNLRDISISRGDGGIKLKTIRSINHYLSFVICLNIFVVYFYGGGLSD